jgi:hypothetical protein
MTLEEQIQSAEQTLAKAETGKIDIDELIERTVAERVKLAGEVHVDDGQFANYLDTGRFNQISRLAHMFASSGVVPKHYQGEPASCHVATTFALNMGMDPLGVMQVTYIIGGKLAWQGQAYAGLLKIKAVDRLKYDDGGAADRGEPVKRMRCIGVRKGEDDYVGPWVTWEMVEAEGWNQNKGSQKSKWQTMPEVMFRYRSAAFLARTEFPELFMGIYSDDELRDAGMTDDLPRQAPAPALNRTESKRDPMKIMATEIQAAIHNAKTIAELDASVMAASALPPEYRDPLRSQYKAAKDALRAKGEKSQKTEPAPAQGQETKKRDVLLDELRTMFGEAMRPDANLGEWFAEVFEKPLAQATDADIEGAIKDLVDLVSADGQ